MKKMFDAATQFALIKEASNGTEFGITVCKPVLKELERLEAEIVSLKLEQSMRLSAEEQNKKLYDLAVTLLKAVEANNTHHQDYDEYDGYPGSELFDINSEAIKKAKKVLK